MSITLIIPPVKVECTSAEQSEIIDTILSSNGYNSYFFNVEQNSYASNVYTGLGWRRNLFARIPETEACDPVDIKDMSFYEFTSLYGIRCEDNTVYIIRAIAFFLITLPILLPIIDYYTSEAFYPNLFQETHTLLSVIIGAVIGIIGSGALLFVNVDRYKYLKPDECVVIKHTRFNHVIEHEIIRL